ncbi:S9 family peptidase [Microtetraspora sp. AC03309]|uniref:alpha/beta hydrolase family protein n=1 Tax=Microtetraspora sp. AC03309 TaxID=2779376 RepID=UPI001E3965CF|nr:alpha/beta fold hydrolase [Microtetraspora sp. AC03309]MCC5578820.1 S9 family peptidase [Microtetraspora sp. AC03309]
MSSIVTAERKNDLRDVTRINFRFSGQGRYAACLTRLGRDRLTAELWDLADARPLPRLVRTRAGETSLTMPVPTDVGALLLCRFGLGEHRLSLVAPSPYAGEDAEEHELGVLRGNGVRFVVGTAGGAAALAFEACADGRTTVWRLSGRAEQPEPIAEFPYLVKGGVWLDEAGRHLALTTVKPASGTVVLDTSRGSLAPPARLARDEHLLLAAPGAGSLITVAQCDGAYRLGVRHRDAEGPACFPDRLNAIEGAVTPLALDPMGRRLALMVTRRTRAHLLLHDLVHDTVTEADLPPGMLYPAAHWSTAGLHVIHTAPDSPPAFVRVPEPSVPPVPAGDVGSGVRGEPARVRSYQGAAGSIEAIVYGTPETSPQVVLALHGGPESAWQFAYDPLFQRLAAAGIAVVAPNQRGSTGYGAAHRDAIRDAWGGPDLADILHLGRALAAARGPERPRPMLYGVSYGAFLALLAAAAETDLWSRAAVVAPFLSGQALSQDGSAAVRALLDRLGGRAELADDALGSRDLLRLADRIRLPLLIVHGQEDPIIPVTHSRRLYDRLRESGRRVGAEVTYLEVPGGGHDPLHETSDGAVLDRIVRFFDSGSSGGL